MARMRTIKPEFWTSEPIVALSPFARLLFIGLWNFSDDGGVHPASLARIKMEVLPNDPLSPEEMEKLLGELTRRQPNGEPALVLEFTGDDGKAYWFVRSFAEHQKPEKPTIRFPQYSPGKSPPKSSDPVPAPKLAGADSETPRGEFAEQSPNSRRAIGYGKGIGKGSGGEITRPGSSNARMTPAPIPRSVGAMVGPVMPKASGGQASDFRKKTKSRALERASDRKPEAGSRKPVSAFADLGDRDLRDTARMIAWWQRESRSSNPVVGRAELDRLNVLAAAERALEVAARPASGNRATGYQASGSSHKTKSPALERASGPKPEAGSPKPANAVALFARIVSGKLWRLISNEQEERARARLLAWRRELAARERACLASVSVTTAETAGDGTARPAGCRRQGGEAVPPSREGARAGVVFTSESAESLGAILADYLPVTESKFR